MALHTTSIIQIHQTALIQLPPLQYVRGALATAKHSLSAHRVCLHILISPPQHTFMGIENLGGIRICHPLHTSDYQKGIL